MIMLSLLDSPLSFLLLLLCVIAVRDLVVGDDTSSNNNYTDDEILKMHSLDWCVGDDDNPIQWVNKDVDAVTAKIAAGARPAPPRNENGQIDDLDGFVQDRLLTLPQEAINDNLPTMIIENDCASVTTSSDECIFDYAATPAPLLWPNNGQVPASPVSIVNWEREDMTVVYVPASDSSDDAKELTKSTSQDDLARLKTRGNSSRQAPKKQYSLKLPNKEILIPGGAEAKKWVLSAYTGDKSFIENKLVFDMYTKFGELQKKFSDTWPEEGSDEDLLTRAYAPQSQMINLIFQGRYTGIYYLMDKVEEQEGRVWLPKEASDPKKVDDIQLPTGNYFLSRDWNAAMKASVNPFRYSDSAGIVLDLNKTLIVPNFRNSTDDLYEYAYSHFLNVTNVESPMGWSIESPDDKSFANTEADEDIALLEGFLLKLHEWLEDPIKNDSILSEVIDIPSMARWFLLVEFTREVDAYDASMFFKVSDGKLYHASPWDYAGTSFTTATCEEAIYFFNTIQVDRETNTYLTVAPCNESTGNTSTVGWQANTLHWYADEMFCNPVYFDLLGDLYKDLNCSEGEPTVSDTRWFFGMMFRIPALQKEFWNLVDIVVEHRLIEENVLDSGDLFSADLFADQIFEPIRSTVSADKRIWYSTLENTNVSLYTTTIDPKICGALLEDSLVTSGAGNTSSPDDPFAIPGQDWAFHTAYENGKFISFYEGLLAEGPIDVVSDYIDSDYMLAKKKQYFKYRLEWIMSQHPGSTNNINNKNTSTVESIKDSKFKKTDNGDASCSCAKPATSVLLFFLGSVFTFASLLSLN